jgi:hypothetical protein
LHAIDDFCLFLNAALRGVKILTWQNPGQLFVVQGLLKNVKPGAAEFR